MTLSPHYFHFIFSFDMRIVITSVCSHHWTNVLHTHRCIGPGGGSKIEATFKGPDSIVLRQLADQAKTIMISDGGAMAIQDDLRQAVSIIEPIYSETAGRRAGVSREDLGSALRTNFSGSPVGVYREGDDLL